MSHSNSHSRFHQRWNSIAAKEVSTPRSLSLLLHRAYNEVYAFDNVFEEGGLSHSTATSMFKIIDKLRKPDIVLGPIVRKLTKAARDSASSYKLNDGLASTYEDIAATIGRDKRSYQELSVTHALIAINSFHRMEVCAFLADSLNMCCHKRQKPLRDLKL